MNCKIERVIINCLVETTCPAVYDMYTVHLHGNFPTEYCRDCKARAVVSYYKDIFSWSFLVMRTLKIYLTLKLINLIKEMKYLYILILISAVTKSGLCI